MKKPRKRLDRPTFWKWAIPLVLGDVVLTILGDRSFGGIKTFVIVITVLGLARLVLIAPLFIALARRFRDIGWPAWIGSTILLVTMLGLPVVFLVYAGVTSDEDILEWAPTVAWISDSLSLLLLIVAGFMPGKPASIEVAHVFD
jgi:uncharacterized membrane protein YhaH (DUF805 family)